MLLGQKVIPLLFDLVIRIWKLKEIIPKIEQVLEQDIIAIVQAPNGRQNIGLARHGSL
jgi:hypothetical protein